MLHTTQLSFSLSLPLLASSQSAETPCVSAKQWSIPSVYFTYFVLYSCCLSLILLFLLLLFVFFLFRVLFYFLSVILLTLVQRTTLGTKHAVTKIYRGGKRIKC